MRNVKCVQGCGAAYWRHSAHYHRERDPLSAILLPRLSRHTSLFLLHKGIVSPNRIPENYIIGKAY
jgi:hypothetical protein